MCFFLFRDEHGLWHMAIMSTSSSSDHMGPWAKVQRPKPFEAARSSMGFAKGACVFIPCREGSRLA